MSICSSVPIPNQLFNLHSIHRNPCTPNTSPRSQPRLGVLVVRRPRRNHNHRRHNRPGQPNAQRKVNILVDETDDESNCLWSVSACDPVGEFDTLTPKRARSTVLSTSAMRCPWKSCAWVVSCDLVVVELVAGVWKEKLTIWPSRVSWIGSSMPSMFVSSVLVVCS